MMRPAGDRTVYHLINAASRSALWVHGIAPNALQSSEQLTRLVEAQVVPHALVQAVNLKVRTPHVMPLAVRPPKAPTPITLVTGRKLTPEEFAVHVQAMAMIAPQGHGFRTPSAKAKNWASTTLVEQASMAAGLSPPRGVERSARGLAKLEADRQTKALIHLERLIRDHYDRAVAAKTETKARRWFFGRVMALVDGDIDPDWLESTVARKIETGVQIEYLSAAARRRLAAKVFGVEDLVYGGEVTAPDLREAA